MQTFCEQEDFELLSFDDLNFESEYSIVVIIVDDISLLDEVDTKSIPVCVINPTSKIAYKHYTLDKNFDLVKFRELIDCIYHGGIMGSFQTSVRLEKIHKRFLIGNDIYNVDKIVNQLTSELVYFFSISDIQKLRIGISEILTNAIEHGNLAITGDEKFEATENEEYDELLQERLLNFEYSNRKIIFDFYLDKKELKIYIEDEGDGFNVDEPVSNDNPDDLLRLHGRGILISKMYFDEIIYNEKGNAVTLLKRI